MIEWSGADEALQEKWLALKDLVKESEKLATPLCIHVCHLASEEELEELVLVKDENGLCLLNLAIQERGCAPLDVIELLLDCDLQKLTIHQKDKELETLPIHRALMFNSGEDIIRLLLDADKLKETIHIQGTASKYLPIHIAADRDASPEVLKLLLDADMENKTIYDRSNIHGLRPIHLALNVKAKQEIIELLLEADKTHEAISVSVLNVLLNGYPLSSDWMDNFISEPLLKLILDPHSYEDDVECSFSKSRVPNALRSKEGIKLTTRPRLSKKMHKEIKGCSVPLDVYPLLAQSIAKSPELQDLVNDNSVERHVVGVMLADFYANCTLICLFMHASDVYVTGGNAIWSFVGLYVLVCYFVLRMLLKASAQGSQFSLDMWNIYSACKMILVLASTIVMQLNRGSINRALLCWTSAFVFLGMISFLRSTFQPFSGFVSGVLKIFYVLLPFFVVSGLILVAFSYMYHITRYEPNCNCGEFAVCKCDEFTTLQESFYVVYGYFVGGPDETTDFLDIVFGLVVVIIFLNVVIAIVSTAWEITSEHGAESFWLYRLSFLAELRPLEKFLRNLKGGGKIKALGERIDKVGEQRVFDRIEWTQWPYNFVKSKEDYDHPGQLNKELSKRVVDESMAQKLREKLKTMKSFHADWKFSKTPHQHRTVLRRFARWFLINGACFLLGIITFGFFWPRRFRKALFGNNKTTPDENSELQEKMQSQIDSMEHAVGKLNGQLHDILKVMEKRERRSTMMERRGRRSTKVATRMCISHTE